MKHAQKFTARILLVNFCFFVRFSSAFTCDYRPPEYDEIMEDNMVGNDPRISDRHRPARSSRENMTNLRFHAFFDSSIDSMKDSSVKNYIKNKLIPEAMDFWHKVLSVVPRKSAILFRAQCTNRDVFDRDEIFNGKPATMCAAYVDCSLKCGESQIPDAHLHACYSRPHYWGMHFEEPSLRKEAGPGVLDADFALYVSSHKTQRCTNNDTIAYAAHCLLDPKNNRPIAGHTNICPSAVESHLRNHDLLLSTIKHEMVHALAFSSSLFKYYQDQAGKKIPIGKVLENKTFTDWYTHSGLKNHTVTYVITPRVQQFVREHFNCSNLIGAQLEDQGMEGTAGTHWEKRLFENEGLAGTHTQSPVYSTLTFSLLEDSGWYGVDYLYAEPLFWGKNLGCDFAEKSCAYWIATHRKENKSIAPFCDTVKEKNVTNSKTTCTLRRDSLAICNLQEYTKPVEPEYQIFDWLPGVPKSADLTKFGGSVELADFCPFLQGFDWKDKMGHRLRDSRCNVAENQPPRAANGAMEEFAPNSRCFLHGGGNWTARRCQFIQVSTSFAGCHQFGCSNNLVWLVMNEGQIKYPCYMEGQVITVRRIWKGWAHEGKVICPSCEILCEKPNSDFKCDRPIKPPREIGDLSVNIPCGARVAFLGAFLAFGLLCSNFICYCHTFFA